LVECGGSTCTEGCAEERGGKKNPVERPSPAEEEADERGDKDEKGKACLHQLKHIVE
jgi:hypothetical protein